MKEVYRLTYRRYLIQRVIYLLITLWLIVSLTFFLMKFLPGSPFANEEMLTASQLASLKAKYHLDLPLWQQYGHYLANALRGDLGISFQFNNTPVTDLIKARALPSIQLGLQAMLLGTIVGTLLGCIAAVKHNSCLDYLTSVLAIGGRSVPNFVFAVALQFVFAVTLHCLPIAFWKDGFLSTILPTLALAIGPTADAARFVRTEMVEVLNTDYIELATAKGFSKSYVIFSHALRNAIIPLLTILGPMTAGLMTGSLVIENIFSIPGIGEQFTKSILVNDYPTIMGITILYSSFLLVFILLVDILYGWIDPRMKLSGGEAE
ncbi:ABC transporter permease [Atopobacter sp. AH10]|uniref:ABC transporter permease n=1 Tax=Atopobacter sp. AH10 TaxID=2315861 RepID=UPI00272AEDA3|nr:ABC transporter permease [Atopobacter sp. AH10]